MVYETRFDPPDPGDCKEKFKDIFGRLRSQCLSLQHTGIRLGVSDTAIGHYESGRTAPHGVLHVLEMAVAICLICRKDGQSRVDCCKKAKKKICCCITNS